MIELTMTKGTRGTVPARPGRRALGSWHASLLVVTILWGCASADPGRTTPVSPPVTEESTGDTSTDSAAPEGCPTPVDVTVTVLEDSDPGAPTPIEGDSLHFDDWHHPNRFYLLLEVQGMGSLIELDVDVEMVDGGFQIDKYHGPYTYPLDPYDADCCTGVVGNMDNLPVFLVTSHPTQDAPLWCLLDGERLRIVVDVRDLRSLAAWQGSVEVTAEVADELFNTIRCGS